MKFKILLSIVVSLIASVALASSAVQSPKPENVLTDKEVVGYLLEKVRELEKKMEMLDQQMEVTSRQAFLEHGLYVVRPGDTLEGIAELHGISLKQILELNEGMNPEIEVAQLVKVERRET